MPVSRFSRGSLFVLGLLCLAGILAYHFWTTGDQPSAPRFRTIPLSRGALVSSVSANGTLNPVVVIHVGTQVSGTIKRLLADFNDHVDAGQVVAELDPALIEAQYRVSKANLASAQASLKLAEANVRRIRPMVEKRFIAAAELDKEVQALDVARAQLETARAQVKRDETNLGYTVIRSPISGVVISRDVDVGQTVAASFQTPTLFKIAENLSLMQIDTSLAEADVGAVRVGQPVNFSVDAFPERAFEGKVRQIRLNPAIQQNVVTYNVVVDVANPEHILLPGMTAYVTIRLGELPDVLRVPLAALRYRPNLASTQTAPGNEQTVYRLEGGEARPVRLRSGASDGQYAALLQGELREGDELVVEDLQASGSQTGKPGLKFRLF